MNIKQTLATIFLVLSQASYSADQIFLYSSIQPSHWDLFVFNNTVAKQITENRYLDYNPVYSPDGGWIVFTSEQSGTAHLYLLDAKNLTAKPIRLTDSIHFEDQAVFSPKGDKLYFVSARDGLADIFEIPFQPNKITSETQWKNLTNQNGSNLRPSISPDGQWIVFSSNRDEQPLEVTSPQPSANYKATDLYLMKSDGTNVKRLTDHPDWDGSPVFSPDGKSIYFYSIRESKSRIYRINVDGSHLQPISPKPIAALSPTMKPDGRLAFSANILGRWIIVSTKLDGTDLQYESDTRLDYAAPKYNPKTGELITYARGASQEPEFLDELPGGIFGDIQYLKAPMAIGPFFITESKRDLEGAALNIYAVRGYFPNYNPKTQQVASVRAFQEVVLSQLSGKEMKPIFRAPFGAFIGLTWSMDGEHLAVASGAPFATSDTNVDLWVFDREGKNGLNVTKNLSGNAAFPRFMPNGKEIIFRYGRGNSKNIYRMNINGNDLVQLTYTQGTDTMPDVSPDGETIVYASQREGKNYHLYLLGENEMILTDGPTADVHPTFSPDGEWVAFSSERGGILDETPLIPVFSPQPYGDIYAIRLKDKKVVRITEAKWENSLPNWK